MNLKPFDLEEAKANPERVVTETGRKARIVCWDRKSEYGLCLVALVEFSDVVESVMYYDNEGRADTTIHSDLRLLPVKKEGWVMLFKSISDKEIWIGPNLFETKEDAESSGASNFIGAVKIEWEE